MWRLSGSVAHWEHPLATLTIDAARPNAGVALAPTRGAAPRAARWLRIHKSRSAPESLQDVYTRGADLVARYVAADQPDLTLRVYWRALPEDSGESPRGNTGAAARASAKVLGLELVLAVQTELLDSDPALDVVSELPPGMLSWVPAETARPGVATAEGAIVVHGDSSVPSQVVMAHPRDAHLFTLRLDGAHGLIARHRLFPERLEKGVIRQGRLRAYLLPCRGDANEAARRLAAFAASAAPLTT